MPIGNNIHSVPMGMVRFWMESSREQLGIDEAKGWAIHKWTERRLNRNNLPHLPTIRHKKHKGILVSAFDNLVDRECLDECKMCLRWIEKVLHRQSGYHTHEDKMYILSFHSERVKIYNSLEDKYLDYHYPYTWSMWSYTKEKTVMYTRTSPWDWEYHKDDSQDIKKYKRLHNKFLHITKDAVIVNI